MGVQIALWNSESSDRPGRARMKSNRSRAFFRTHKSRKKPYHQKRICWADRCSVILSITDFVGCSTITLFDPWPSTALRLLFLMVFAGRSLLKEYLVKDEIGSDSRSPSLSP